MTNQCGAHVLEYGWHAVARVISETCAVDEKIITATSRLDELGLDSFDRVELFTALEERFNVDLDEAAAGEWETVRDLWESVDAVQHAQVIAAARSVA